MTEDQPVSQPREISVMDYVHILSRWRFFIIVVVGVIGLLAAIGTLFLPNRYKSTTRLLPPSKSTTFPSSIAQITKDFLPIAGLGSLQMSRESQNYLAILQSYTATKSLIDRFHLTEVYNSKDGSVERTMRAVRGFLDFTIEPEGTIAVSVWDIDPVRAANMANFLVETLNRISIDLATRDARNNREFLEKRIELTRSTLREKEDSLRMYQEKSGTMYVYDEGISGLSVVADLYALKARLEVELGVLERTVDRDSPLIAQKRTELSEVNRQVSKIPETGLKSLRLLRDVLIHQKILEYITPLYEQASIDEQKEVPVILVLDKAVPAELKDTPNRTIIVLATGLIALIVSILTVFFLESYTFWGARTSRKPGNIIPRLRGMFRVGP